MITLAVDAMGGDAGLSVTVPGAVSFLRRQADARLLMVGDEAAIVRALSSAAAPMDRETEAPGGGAGAYDGGCTGERAALPALPRRASASRSRAQRRFLGLLKLSALHGVI